MILELPIAVVVHFVFDLVLPEDMMSQGNQIKDYILHSINKGKSKYLLDVTFDIDTND